MVWLQKQVGEIKVPLTQLHLACLTQAHTTDPSRRNMQLPTILHDSSESGDDDEVVELYQVPASVLAATADEEPGMCCCCPDTL